MASNKRKKKKHAKQLNMVMKERREREIGVNGYWSAHTKHTLPFNYNNTAKDKGALGTY